MDDKNLSDQLSNLFPPSGSGQNQVPDATRGILETLAGQAGGPLQNQLSQFLNGEGQLLDVTSKAATTGGDFATNIIVTFLTSTLKLNPAIANMVAPLLLQLLPSVAGNLFGGQAAQETAAKPKSQKKTTSKKTTSSKSTAKPKSSVKSSTSAKTTTKKTGKKVVPYSD
jgi:hypothetical protein